MPNLKKGWEDLRVHRCIHTLFSTIGKRNDFKKYSFQNLRKVQSTYDFEKMFKGCDFKNFFWAKNWKKSPNIFLKKGSGGIN